MVPFVVAVGLGACGGAARPVDRAPACDEVALHMVQLANRDNRGEAGPELASGMRSELDRQCRETPWSSARRRCLRDARSQDATLACPTT
jgi:hypothetical protein